MSPDNCGRSGKLRILLLAEVFPPRLGGIEHYVYSIYSRLASKYSVTVITPEWPGASPFDANQPFRVVRSPQMPWLGQQHGAPLIGMFMCGLKEIIQHRPHQIHCDQVDAAIVGRMLAAVARVPYLTFAYGMEITSRSHGLLKRWAATSAHAVIAISQYTRARVVEQWDIPAQRLDLVHPGVDVNRFHPGVSSEKVRHDYNLQRKRVILTVGRLSAGERYKGQDILIQCMPAILSQVPEATYLIVGDGSDQGRLITKVKECRLEEKVVFAGAVPDEELPGFYAACDVFAMPSRIGTSKHGGTMGEGFGIVFVEAGAMGKPVVGGRSGGIPDAVVDGVTGLLVDPTDLEQISRAIISLLLDSQLRCRMGHAGRKRAQEHFQWEIAAQNISRIVDGLSRRSLE